MLYLHAFPYFYNQIRFQPNDHKTIKETADELKIFEGIKHPNLVRYFGVELHRVRGHSFDLKLHMLHTEAVFKCYCTLLQEEMYIFMEYCDEGTLEEVSRLGLQEHVIRLYSKQITTAINVLHEHGIVHRDIKGLRSRFSLFLFSIYAPLANCSCFLTRSQHFSDIFWSN